MDGGKQNGPNNNPSTSCTSCVRTLSECLKKCSNCYRQTCVNCLSACDSCLNSICGMCSIEDQNNYLRLCLGCRDSRNWRMYLRENRIIWLYPENDDLTEIKLLIYFSRWIWFFANLPTNWSKRYRPWSQIVQPLMSVFVAKTINRQTDWGLIGLSCLPQVQTF